MAAARQGRDSAGLGYYHLAGRGRCGPGPSATRGLAIARNRVVLSFTYIGSERVAYTDPDGLTHIVPLDIAGDLAESSAAELPDPYLPRSAADSDAAGSQPPIAECQPVLLTARLRSATPAADLP